jgi:23S rRNA (adenine2503-C2)-methyltransferase
MTLPEMRGWARELGLPAFRAAQVHHGMFKRLAESFEEFSDLPLALRAEVDRHGALRQLSVEHEVADDWSRTAKTLFKMRDGALVESVLMGYEDRRGHRRHTVCLSSQVGCALGCTFCATGLMGWARNLTAAEMVEQVLHFARRLKEQGDRITNVVYMGMGEPFLNYDAVMQSLRVLTEPAGFNLGARHITVSTSGVVPAILRFASEDTQVGLAVSLHAADDALRSRLVPLNRRYPVSDLIDACRQYVRATNRRISFEYTMLAGVNDRQEDAAALARLLRGMLCHVNLIPWNHVDGLNFHPSSRAAILDFQDELAAWGLPVTIRDTRGSGITAACDHGPRARRSSRVVQAPRDSILGSRGWLCRLPAVAQLARKDGAGVNWLVYRSVIGRFMSAPVPL